MIDTKMFQRYSLRSCIPLVLVFLLNGCTILDNLLNSTLSSPKREQSNNSSEKSSQDGELPPVRVEKRQGLQVTWQVPSEPVDGFILRYGERPESLKIEKRIPSDSIVRDEDPEFGPVYRFTIPDIGTNSPLYVSIAAYKGERLSDFSEVMKDSSRQ